MKTKLPGLLAGAALITFVATPAFAQTPADLKVGVGHGVGPVDGRTRVLHEPGLRAGRIRDVPVEEHRQHPLEELHRLRHLQPGLLHLRMGADVWKRQRVRRAGRPVHDGRRRQQPGHRRRLRRRVQGDCLDRRSAEREVLLPARLRRHRGDDRLRARSRNASSTSPSSSSRSCWSRSSIRSPATGSGAAAGSRRRASGTSPARRSSTASADGRRWRASWSSDRAWASTARTAR